MTVAAKTLLVLATLVFLASMGGGMVFAVWFLVPLHWLAARSSGPYATAGWSVLAAASVAEVAWMAGYVAAGHNETVAIAVMPLAFVAALVGFLAARARSIPA